MLQVTESLSHGRVEQRSSRDNDNIPTGDNSWTQPPNRLTDEPSGPIAPNGLAQSLAGDDSESRLGPVVARDSNDNSAARKRLPFNSKPLELRFTPEPATGNGAEWLRCRVCHLCWRSQLDRGQLLPPARPASRQDLSSVAGRHSMHEAVAASATALLWLIGTLWHSLLILPEVRKVDRTILPFDYSCGPE